jgi:colanic acid/amylovoran biosynthesis glycosyltransferase
MPDSNQKNKKLKIAFLVGGFPVVSETFIINQVADLIDRGMQVEIFSFKKGNREAISERYYKYKMKNLTHYIGMPESRILRIILALSKVMRILLLGPGILSKVFNFKRYKKNALSLKLLFWVEPFLGKKFDLVHCHFGPIANKFLIIKEILGIKTKIITTFYGYDVSIKLRQKPKNYYDRLKKESSLFFVMSNNMKKRVVDYGFLAEKVKVLPISIDVSSYPFWQRQKEEGETINIVSVGRFVEKKGLDDLLRALAIVRKKTKRRFKCSIIGGGPSQEELYGLTNSLNINDIVEYKGYMKIEDIINYFQNMHLYVQPSKTASTGDME